MNDADYEKLLDLVSEAALAPRLWSPVMASLTEMVGGRGAMLSRLSIRDGTGAAEFVRSEAAEAQRAFEYYAPKNPTMIVHNPADYRRTWIPRVLTDDELLPKSDLMRTEFYNGFMRPLDIHSVMFIRLALHDDDVFAISISRAERHDRFGADDLAVARRLHPHLLRSFALGQKFAASGRNSDNLADALSQLRHAVMLVSDDGRVLHVNAAAEKLMARSADLIIRGGRLTASNHSAARRLEQLIGVAGSADAAQRTSGSMTTGVFDRRNRLSIAVSPLRSARDSIFGSEACVMVAITDSGAQPHLDERRLRDLFSLSPAEARVALAILHGRSPKEAAASLGISFFTVRGHLVRIFEKTNTNRQVELVRVLMQVTDAV